MKYILLILPFLVGCGSTEEIVSRGYDSLCNRQPESMSCIRHEDTGYYPSYQQVYDVAIKMLGNFTYVTDNKQYGVDEYWFDNVSTDILLKGDCDDISLTFASQLILDGVNPSNIRFLASGIDGKLKHYYVKVKLDNGTYFDFYRVNEYTDIMYMQYDQVGTFVKL